MIVKRYRIDGKLNKKVKIAHVSDLHDRKPDFFLEQLKSEKPDFIFVTGDLVDTKMKDSKCGMSTLKKFSSIAKTFYSMGNHEYLFESDDIEKIKECGVTPLLDEYALFDEIAIGGLTSCGVLDKDVKEKTRNMKLVPHLKWLDDFEKEKKFKILLNHHPEYYKRYLMDRNIDLILSGHAHGGQMRFFGRGLFAPGQGLLPKYTEGFYDSKMIVSSGLANTGKIFPRLFNRRELVIIEIE